MLPAVTIPAAQVLAPTVNAPAAVPTAPVSAAANVVFNAVPANTSSVALFNNVRGDSGGVRGTGTTTSTTSANASSSSASGGRFPSLGFNSLFVAQAISQDDNNGLYSRLSYPMPNSPTPDQALLERFALTKYLPSNAAQPRPEPTGTSNIQPATPQVNAENIPRPPVQENPIVLRQQTSPPEPVQMATNTAPVASTVQATTQPTIRALRSDSPFTSRFMMGQGETSLIRQDGVNAYLATFSRSVNELNVRNNPPISLTL